MKRALLTIVALYLLTIRSVSAWGSGEMEMFDLVDELKINFYEFLGVSEDASTSEIKRAYRKLSLQMHPDKNTEDPDAPTKFRHLVGVYEVLKDTELREKYNDVLKNGLPSWRTPVFYYRQLRKMSNTESFLIFAVIATVVHYAALWGSAVDKRWTLEDQLSTALKRHKVPERKREAVDLEIAKQLQTVSGPKWSDLLPFAICKGLYWLLFTFAPQLVRYNVQTVKVTLKERLEAAAAERLDEQLRAEKQERKRRTAQEQQQSRRKIEQEAAELTASYHLLSLEDLPDSPENTETKSDEGVGENTKEWTEDDMTALVRAVARFPGGVPNRWGRIAESLGRNTNDVIVKARELGENKLNTIYKTSTLLSGGGAFETNENDMCFESSSNTESDVENDDDQVELTMNGRRRPKHQSKRISKRERRRQLPDSDGLTAYEAVEVGTDVGQLPIQCATDNGVVVFSSENVDVDEPYLSRKKLKQQKVTSKIGELKAPKLGVPPLLDGGWSQKEQKQLEIAIRSIPKGAPERWDRIADCVPSKTKVEVMARVKLLSTAVKSKTLDET